MTQVTPMALRLEQIEASYGGVRVLHGVSLEVAPGSVVALLGPNGAGKTTLLRVASGLLSARGRVLLGEKDVSSARPARRAREGLCLIPEGRGVFPGLTVRENLRLLLPPWRSRYRVDAALDVFPALRGRLHQRAGSMSGGQQQMLALARAWLADPRVVLLDEVSMGLAPLVVDEIFEALDVLRGTGAALLLVEQYVDRALEMADTAYLMDRGRVTFSGPATSLDRDAVLASYLGLAATT